MLNQSVSPVPQNDNANSILSLWFEYQDVLFNFCAAEEESPEACSLEQRMSELSRIIRSSELKSISEAAAVAVLAAETDLFDPDPIMGEDTEAGITVARTLLRLSGLKLHPGYRSFIQQDIPN